MPLVVDFRRACIWEGFPAGSVVKNPSTNAGAAGDVSMIPGAERIPWGRKRQPTLVFLPGKSHEQKSLAGYSLRDRKESDMTEPLSTHTIWERR